MKSVLIEHDMEIQRGYVDLTMINFLCFRFVLPHVMIALHYALGGKKMKEEEVVSTRL